MAGWSRRTTWTLPSIRSAAGPRRPGSWSGATDEDLRERFRTLGYSAARTLEEATIVVARAHDKAIADHVRNGASLLLLPEADMGLVSVLPALAGREGPVA